MATFMPMNTRDGLVRVGRVVLAVLAVAALAGCSATPKPVQPGQHFELDGITLQPPQGANWSYVENNDAGFWTIHFEQKCDDIAPDQKIGRTVFVYVESGHYNELNPGQTNRQQLEEISRSLTEPAQGRFHDLVNTTTWQRVDGQEAIRIHSVGEDTDHPQEPNAVLTLDTDYVFCTSPFASRRGLLVIASQRWQKGQHPIALQSLTDSFLRGVHFAPSSANPKAVGGT